MIWQLDIREGALADIEAAAVWYEGQQITVFAVIHAARHDRHWRKRV